MTILEQERINQDKGIPGWLELYDLGLHGDMEARLPIGAYIRGNISPGRQFSPASNIIGTAISKPEGIDSDRGWVELETLTFHRDMEAVAHLPPYVQGEMDENNHFYPDEPYQIISTEI